MATIKQIEANRSNATKSTGPRTTEGKTAVRLNALKHGLFAESTVIEGENKDAFDELRDSWVLRWQPATPEEETLVTNLIRYTWLLDRFSKVERRIWDFRLPRFPGADRKPDAVVAEAHTMVYKELDHLQRRLNSTHRNYRADLELLIKLQTARKAAPTPEPIFEPKPAESVNPVLGFVPTYPPKPQDPRQVPHKPEPFIPPFLEYTGSGACNTYGKDR